MHVEISFSFSLLQLAGKKGDHRPRHENGETNSILSPPWEREIPETITSTRRSSISDRVRNLKFVEAREVINYYKKKCLFHQFVHSPTNIQTPQIAIVLTDAQKHHGNTSGVHHADERADHVAHGVALGDDEAVHADAVVAELALWISLVAVVLKEALL